MSLINSLATRKVLLDSLFLDTRAFDLQDSLGLKNINHATLYNHLKLACGKFIMACKRAHVCLMLLRKRVGRASSICPSRNLNLCFSFILGCQLINTT